MRPRSSMELGDKYLQAQECRQSCVWDFCYKVRAMPAPTLKSPEEREFVVDSGASMHLLSRKMSSEELDTLRRSRHPLWWLRPVEKCKRGSTSFCSRSWSLRDKCNFSKERLLFYRLENSAKTTGIPMSESAVKSRDWPNRGRQLNAKPTISYRLLFSGCAPILVAIRLQHRHCRICPQQVQLKSDVTD